MFSKFFESFTNINQIREEKSRLEAFLAAFPGEYCGFNPDGTLVYSNGFIELLGLKELGSLLDIQEALMPDDAAALESLFERLKEKGTSFSTHVRSNDKKRTLNLSGAKGEDIEKRDRFYILWIEDITKHEQHFEEMQDTCNSFAQEIKRMRGALDVIPTPIWMRNADSELTWCNLSYAESLNLTPTMVLAKQAELPLTPVNKAKKKELAQNIQTMAETALRSGEVQEDQRHLIVEGKRKLMLVQEIPLRNLDITIGMVRDITREEDLEKEQKRHHSANRELLENIGTAVGIHNSEEQLEFYNSAYTQLWQLDEAWLNTKPKIGDIMEKLRETRRLPEQADFKKYKQYWISMFTSLIKPHEEMLYLPDGTALRTMVMPHPMGGLMMTFEDVTSRLALESSYNTLVAVQKETLDNLSEGVSVYGGDGRLKLWNPSFSSLWSLHPEDLDGEPHITKLVDKMKLLFHEKDRENKKNELLEQGLNRQEQEGRLIRNDGKLLDYSTVSLPDGGMLVTHVDVTDTVQVENALREKNAALEATERLKLDFLANVSYQLRTPLSAIMGFAEILDKEYFGPLNDRQKEYTVGMQEAGERLLSLVNDILDLSTIEAGYMSLQKEEFKVLEMLQGLFELTQDWARKEKIEVKLECPKNIGSITADKRRIKQAILNLIRNAINFTDQGGNISLSAKRRKEHLDIIISDTGLGISKEDQKRIFEPFERIKSEEQQRNGAGLGLSLVKNIIELHEGSLSLESEEGKGSTFIISLPYTPK